MDLELIWPEELRFTKLGIPDLEEFMILERLDYNKKHNTAICMAMQTLVCTRPPGHLGPHAALVRYGFTSGVKTKIHLQGLWV